MKFVSAMTIGLPALLASGMVSAQNSGMMHGGGMSGFGWMGGYGGYWGPILLVVVVGVVVWAILRSRK